MLMLGALQALHATSAPQKSWKVVANSTLLAVEAGASDELPLMIRQSFKDGLYSPLTGMEEVEWQIMLEQFITSGVLVKMTL
jgi:hypothetical protein